MQADDVTTRILIEIRDRIDQTNQRLDQTNQRLDQTNQRLDQTGVRLDHKIDQLRDDLGGRITEFEMRSATAMTEVAGTLRDIHGLMRDRFDLRDRVERCERDIDALKRQTG